MRYRNGAKWLIVLASFIALLGISLPVYADTIIQSTICSSPPVPQINSPANGSQTTQIATNVSGTTLANTLISFTNNGQAAGTVTSGQDGIYGLSVPLVLGQNTLTGTISNPCGSYQSSATVTITRTLILPSTPIQGSPSSPVLPPNPISPSPFTEPLPTSLSPPDAISLKLTYPISGITVHAQHLWITGQAPPSSDVTVTLNGTIVAHVFTDSRGNFGVDVSLMVGINTLQAQITRGGQSIVSTPVTVTYQPLTHYPLWLYILAGLGIALSFLLIILCVVYALRGRKK